MDQITIFLSLLLCYFEARGHIWTSWITTQEDLFSFLFPSYFEALGHISLRWITTQGDLFSSLLPSYFETREYICPSWIIAQGLHNQSFLILTLEIPNDFHPNDELLELSHIKGGFIFEGYLCLGPLLSSDWRPLLKFNFHKFISYIASLGEIRLLWFDRLPLGNISSFVQLLKFFASRFMNKVNIRAHGQGQGVYQDWRRVWGHQFRVSFRSPSLEKCNPLF